MSYLIDDVARTLASPMPRRKAFAAITRLLGGATLGAVFVQMATAAVVCGNTTSQTATNLQVGNCVGGTADATLISAFLATFTCPSNCNGLKTATAVSCVEDRSGTCNGGHPCSVTGTVTCRATCGPNNCLNNACCNTNNNTCFTSAGC
jgi:hypothetical protein